MNSSPEHNAAAELLPLVYDELRRVATALLRREQSPTPLQPTALVHEAYLRLSASGPRIWEDESHFFATAAQTIRRILVDQGLARHTHKRGGGWHRIALDAPLEEQGSPHVELLALEDAMSRLGTRHPLAERVVELRFYGGLSIPETAAFLDVTRSTVAEDWAFARAWLSAELADR